MARKVKAYTKIGFRMAELGERQRKLAKVLRVSQQTVSKKLRGETAILLSDLERLASYYKVPLTYFFEEEPASGELAQALGRVKKGPAALKDLVILVSRLRASSVERVHELAKFIAQGGKGSKRSKSSKGSKGGKGRRLSSQAAEDAARYGRER